MHLAKLLVEGGYFTTAKVAFLVKSYAKNSCDRSFNLIKQCFHRKNACTKSIAPKALNKSSDVTMIDYTLSIFKNYDTLLEKLHKNTLHQL